MKLTGGIKPQEHVTQKAGKPSGEGKTAVCQEHSGKQDCKEKLQKSASDKLIFLQLGTHCSSQWNVAGTYLKTMHYE